MSPGLKPLLREGALFSGCQKCLAQLSLGAPRRPWEAKRGLGQSAEEDQDRTGTRSGPRTPALDTAAPCPLGGSWQTQTVPVSPGAARPSRIRGYRGRAHLLRRQVWGYDQVLGRVLVSGGSFTRQASWASPSALALPANGPA